MTELLEEALRRLRACSPEEQDTIAALILEELEAEGTWQALFAKSLPALDRLAEEALAEDRAGTTTPLDPDNLG